MKEEKKQSMKSDSPHRIVNIHRSNMSSKEALEESTEYKAGKTINRRGKRISGKGRLEESIDRGKNTKAADTGRTTRTTRTKTAERAAKTFIPQRTNETVKREYSSEDFPLLAKPMEIQESKNKGKKQKNSFHGSVKIIPLGGLDQIGMNITAIETEDTMIIVDCGLAFPSGDMLGVDLVIPDISYIKSKIHKLKGFVITHGHEDHIGALPYVLQQVNVPIYATKLTLALIQKKLVENGMDKLVKMKNMKYGQSVSFGDI